VAAGADGAVRGAVDEAIGWASHATTSAITAASDSERTARVTQRVLSWSTDKTNVIEGVLHDDPRCLAQRARMSRDAAGPASGITISVDKLVPAVRLGSTTRCRRPNR
jgi:hypothetical protein